MRPTQANEFANSIQAASAPSCAIPEPQIPQFHSLTVPQVRINYDFRAPNSLTPLSSRFLSSPLEIPDRFQRIVVPIRHFNQRQQASQPGPASSIRRAPASSSSPLPRPACSYAPRCPAPANPAPGPAPVAPRWTPSTRISGHTGLSSTSARHKSRPPRAQPCPPYATSPASCRCHACRYTPHSPARTGAADGYARPCR